MALSDNGFLGAIAGKKSLPTIEVAPARHSEWSPLALPSRARFRCACPRRYRREHSSRPQQGNGTSRNRSNHGCRSPADKALVTWILHRPSRSGAWRTAHGGRIGVADRDAMHGILRQLVKASVNGERPDEVNLAFMISMVKSIKPRDSVEAMLVAQMVCVHVMAMRCAYHLANAQDVAQQDSAGRT